MKRVGIIGFPVESGQKRPGLKHGPNFIRGDDLIEEIMNLGHVVTDYGNMDVAFYPDEFPVYYAKQPKAFATNCLNSRDMVKEGLNSNDCLILLGGDRTMTTGSILGHQAIHRDICVIYVSSKPNLHTPMSLEKGNMNQMPLFCLIKNMQNEIPWINEFKEIYPILPASSIGIIGLHEVDNYEKYLINKCGIKAMSMAEIDRLGMEAVIRETLMSVDPDKERSIHLCFNCDAFDPIFGPSSADSQPGGITLREAVKICEVLADTGNLRIVEITEVNPELGSHRDNYVTRTSAVKLILSSLGYKRCGHPKVATDYYSWTKTSLRRGYRYMK